MINVYALAALAIVYAAMALSSGILTEFTGIVSFLPVALFGATSLLYPYLFGIIHVHAYVILALLFSGTVLGIIFGIFTGRHNRNFFAMLAFGTIAGYSTITLTAKPYFPAIFVVPIISGAALILLFAVYHLLNTPFGDNLTILKNDELSAQLMGKNTKLLKLLGVTISSFLATAAGIIFIHAYPTDFVLNPFVLAMLFFAITTFSGQTVFGNLLGIALIALPLEFLGLLPLSIGKIAAIKEMFFAFIIFLFLLLNSQGLFTRTKLKIKPLQERVRIKKSETPRQKAERLIKERHLTKAQKEKAIQLREINTKLAEKTKIQEHELREKERRKLEKKLLKEQKKREGGILRQEHDYELEKVEAKIKRQELKKEIENEKILRGEGVVGFGLRMLNQQKTKMMARLKRR